MTGKPIMYASTGEKLTEFEVFHPDRMASRILDMGDILTLIEQAEKAFDAGQAEEMVDKLASGQDLTLEDFLTQMQQLRNAGPLKKMMGMLPGMGQMREALDNFDEREVDRIEAIIRSMTPTERRTPKIINGSRRSRIAAGSGTKPSDVNQLLERFDGAQKMMRQMAKGGGVPGMPPGMGNLPGMGGKKSRGRTAAPVRKVKGKSGNPAKRAEQERGITSKPAAPQGSAFGIAPKAEPTQPAEIEACPQVWTASSADAEPSWSCTCAARSSSTTSGRSARRGSSAAGSRSSARRSGGTRRTQCWRAGCCRAWSTCTVTSGWRRTGRSTTAPPRSRPSPTATRGCCSSGTRALRRTPGGCTSGTTCRA